MPSPSIFTAELVFQIIASLIVIAVFVGFGIEALRRM